MHCGGYHFAAEASAFGATEALLFLTSLALWAFLTGAFAVVAGFAAGAEAVAVGASCGEVIVLALGSQGAARQENPRQC